MNAFVLLDLVYKQLTMTEMSKIYSRLTLGRVATIICGVLALVGASFDTVHHAYVGYFFDKVTFLVGCL